MGSAACFAPVRDPVMSPASARQSRGHSLELAAYRPIPHVVTDLDLYAADQRGHYRYAWLNLAPGTLLQLRHQRTELRLLERVRRFDRRLEHILVLLFEPLVRSDDLRERSQAIVTHE